MLPRKIYILYYIEYLKFDQNMREKELSKKFGFKCTIIRYPIYAQLNLRSCIEQL